MTSDVLNTIAKVKYSRAAAIAIAKELVAELNPICSKLIVAGSLRRRKQEVGDVEIVYVPNFVDSAPSDFFSAPTKCNCVDARLAFLIEHAKTLQKRLNREGRESWGDKNKLALHVASKIPVDLFATTEDAWWNYVVCRTGSAENNIAISTAAEKKGWKWHPYRAGFTDRGGDLIRVDSERQVFELVGLDYLEPWER